MPNDSLFWTFDTSVDLYEKYRDCYVDEIYRDVFRYKPIDSSSSLVEVGIGTGHATLPFVQTGASVTAVEYGKNLAAFCRVKFRDYPNLTVVNQKFEDYTCADGTIDLVYSASAFHWIPEETGYTKVYSMLKPGGVFARFANHPGYDPENSALFDAIQEVYKAYAPYRQKPYSRPVLYSEQNAKDRALVAEKYGFTDIAYKMYHSTRTFTADEYIGLLGTYSDNIAMDERFRMRFFEEIRQVIFSFGGSITIFDTLDLQLARKNPPCSLYAMPDTTR